MSTIDVEIDERNVTFHAEGRPIDPAEGMAGLFGRFELAARLPAVRCPAPEVLMYVPPTRRERAHLGKFPRNVWLETEPDLWMSHDGEHLLLAPSDPLLARNLGA